MKTYCEVSVSFSGHATVMCPLINNETPADIAELPDKQIVSRLDSANIFDQVDEDDIEVTYVGEFVLDAGR